jgi:hypothetical protein
LFTALFYKAGVPEAGKTSIPLSLSLSPSLDTAKPVFSLALSLSTLEKGRRFCRRVERERKREKKQVLLCGGWRERERRLPACSKRETFTGV